MTDNDITEAYFVARGWEWKKYLKDPLDYWYWEFNGKAVSEYSRHENYSYSYLPNILESYPDFKQHVLEVMDFEEYRLLINELIVGGVPHTYLDWSRKRLAGEYPFYKEIIKDNNILHAAVIAATRYFEEKKWKPLK